MLSAEEVKGEGNGILNAGLVRDWDLTACLQRNPVVDYSSLDTKKVSEVKIQLCIL